MKKIALITLGLITALGLFAQGHDCQNGKMEMKKGMKGRKGHKMQKMEKREMAGKYMEQLELTAEQREMAKKFREDHRLEMIDVDANLEKLRIKKQSAMSKQNFKEAKKLVDQIATARADKQKAQINLHEKLYKMLTPEQQEKAKELKMNHMPRGRKGFRK